MARVIVSHWTGQGEHIAAVVFFTSFRGDVMEYRSLGASGLRVSALSFGAWVTFSNQLDEDRAYACMKAAFEAGVNFFDNAEAYAYGDAERIMGRVLRRAGWKRSDVVISTKVFWG